jgi:hypothetical protein
LKYIFLRQIKTASPRCRHDPVPSADHNEETRMTDDSADTAKVPLMQQLLDNPFLLLFLGVLIPMVVYTLWGVIDILTIPLAK